MSMRSDDTFVYLLLDSTQRISRIKTILRKQFSVDGLKYSWKLFLHTSWELNLPGVPGSSAIPSSSRPEFEFSRAEESAGLFSLSLTVFRIYPERLRIPRRWRIS